MRDATIMAASGFTMLVLFSLLSAANVIATSTEQSPADIINYARACAKAHEDWLKEQQ